MSNHLIDKRFEVPPRGEVILIERCDRCGGEGKIGDVVGAYFGRTCPDCEDGAIIRRVQFDASGRTIVRVR